MIPTDAAYIAGLIDGEGCIEIHRTMGKYNNLCYSLRITIRMTNIQPIEFVYNTVGGSFKKDKVYPNMRQSYRWYIGGVNTIPFLNTILPFLKNKRDQALLAIQFQTTCINKQGKSVPIEIQNLKEVYYETMKDLKHT